MIYFHLVLEDLEKEEKNIERKVEEKGRPFGGAQSIAGSRDVRTIARYLVANIFLDWGWWQASGQLQHPPLKTQRPGQPGHLYPAADHHPDIFNMCLL